mmetsp:Transcript_39683/g.102052  ORF Transcript_39683/g.102052 Transcript_39683/m.102052 type:complete len:231 (-) Transcript_39683:357-1049(-)
MHASRRHWRNKAHTASASRKWRSSNRVIRCSWRVDLLRKTRPWCRSASVSNSSGRERRRSAVDWTGEEKTLSRCKRFLFCSSAWSLHRLSTPAPPWARQATRCRRSRNESRWATTGFEIFLIFFVDAWKSIEASRKSSNRTCVRTAKGDDRLRLEAGNKVVGLEAPSEEGPIQISLRIWSPRRRLVFHRKSHHFLRVSCACSRFQCSSSSGKYRGDREESSCNTGASNDT